MAKTILAISLLVGAGACSPAPTSQRIATTDSTTSTIEPPTTEPSTTTTVTEPTTEATTSTTEAQVSTETTHPPTTRARSAPTTAPPVAAAGRSDDFWYRLATCESGNGALSANQFQFMGGTAEKVGYYPGASYAEQRAMAIDWAARIHPGEGTSAGWPVCWWQAQ